MEDTVHGTGWRPADARHISGRMLSQRMPARSSTVWKVYLALIGCSRRLFMAWIFVFCCRGVGDWEMLGIDLASTYGDARPMLNPA